MINVIIDPDFINDPILLENKAKIETAFKDYNCKSGNIAWIVLSHNEDKKEFSPCVLNKIEIKKFMNLLNKALHPHLKKRRV